MTNKLLAVVVLLGLLTTAGCRGGWGGLRSRWQAPGGTRNQQMSASVRDPYPSVDEGPELTGVRPQSYTRPYGEPVRSRNLFDYVFGQGR